MKPKVSVIMTVYNGEKYLREAMDSILGQTFRDFELIVIDDGSTDNTPKILASYDDKRIFVFRQNNSGRPKALNRAVVQTKGEYVAIIDADDLALSQRLEKQVKFLDENVELGMLGTAVIEIDEAKNSEKLVFPPTSDKVLRRTLPKYNPFYNSSIMIRKEVFDKVGLYNEHLPGSEDYELGVRIAKHFKIANLSEVLIKKRFHEEQYFLKKFNSNLREKRAASIGLKAARELSCPIHLYFYPILYSVYARLPSKSKPAQLKRLIKERLIKKSSG